MSIIEILRKALELKEARDLAGIISLNQYVLGLSMDVNERCVLLKIIDVMEDCLDYEAIESEEDE